MIDVPPRNCHRCDFPAHDVYACDCGGSFCKTCLSIHLDECPGSVVDGAIDDSVYVDDGQLRLRPYQDSAITHIQAALNESDSTLLVLPTGTGKTVVFSHLARDWQQGKVLILAHREELIFQAADKAEQICGDKPEIEMGEMRAGEGSIFSQSHVVVSSIQTMARPNRHQRFDPRQFGLVIVDEAHHAVANTYRRVLDYFKVDGVKVLGVTATPDRADEEALGQVFESVAFDYEIPDAIRDGWLVPISQQFVYVEGLDLSNCRTTAGDLNAGDLARIMEIEEVLHKVVHPTIELAGDQPTLVFASSVAHAERMAEIFNRHRGDSAVCLHGETPTDDRRRHLERFKRGEFQYLCNCGLFLEGFDCPSIGVVAMARPTKSRALYAQCCGRGTRPLPGIVDGLASAKQRGDAIRASGKPSLLILDFVGNSGRHKLVSAADILGGRESDEVVELAKAEAQKKSKRGESADVLTEIVNATERIEEAARRRRAQVVAKTKFGTKSVNPFDVLDISPTREPGWFKGKRPTERMCQMLERSGVDTSRLSFFEAKQLIGQICQRRDKGLSTFKQIKTLGKFGIDATGMQFQEASSQLDRLAKNNWKPMTAGA